MSKTLLIAECSEIIRKGLRQIISSFGLFDEIHVIGGESDIESSIVIMKPDVLIINPALIKPGSRKVLEGLKSEEEIRLAAIVSEWPDDETERLFDEVIRVGDTSLKIKNKINNLAGKRRERPNYEPENVLSAREKDVVRLLAKGLTNKKISEQLFISPHTVITHRKNITRKLNIRSVAGLIVYAIINEIATVDDMQVD
jgi:DNA-binding CsgD family transcriptional regulator